jgi:hypothetical protein
MGSCAKPTGALASIRVRVRMAANQNAPGVTRTVSGEGSFIIMRVSRVKCAVGVKGEYTRRQA